MVEERYEVSVKVYREEESSGRVRIGRGGVGCEATRSIGEGEMATGSTKTGRGREDREKVNRKKETGVSQVLLMKSRRERELWEKGRKEGRRIVPSRQRGR